MSETTPRFPLGRVLITPNAQQSLHHPDVIASIARHERGDWGELDDDDKRENDRSLEQGFRLLSAYTDSGGVKFWIITEADRSATTVLLPEDY